MKFIIGRKIEMSQRYRQNGEVVPVTVLKVDPCVVTQVKTAGVDGYVSIQLGTGSSRVLTKPELGHRKDFGPVRTLREFRLDSVDGIEAGATCDASVFASGDVVQVTGVSKGKGFQGVVKRHGFAGGPATHGHKDNLRMPGSIGSGGIQHVLKGLKMAGRMGGDRVTVKNLEIIEADAERGTVAIKGAVPGARGAVILVAGPGEMSYKSAKKSEKAEEAPVAEAAPAAEAAAN